MLIKHNGYHIEDERIKAWVQEGVTELRMNLKQSNYYCLSGDCLLFILRMGYRDEEPLFGVYVTRIESSATFATAESLIK